MKNGLRKHTVGNVKLNYITSLETEGGGDPKMAEEYDGETTFPPTNSSKEHVNAEQTT